MGVCLGDLDARQVERLRTELAETLAAQFAYPPFFDYTAGHAKARPADREKRDEIARYLSSVNFSELDRVDVRSPELRRFLERLLLRYIEVNPTLARQQFARRLSELRSGVPRAAAQVQRGLVALTESGAPAFGARRQPISWSGQSASRPALLPEDELEYHTGVLQATLSRSHQAVQAQPAASGASRQAPVTGAPSAGAPSAGAPTAGASPYGAFGAFGGAAQGGAMPPFGASSEYQPTRPIPSVGAPSAPERNGSTANGPREMLREVPPDLYQLYGDYLTDMHAAVRPPTNAPAPSAPRAPGSGVFATAAPVPAPGTPTAGAPSTGGSRQDEMIFSQLRYQVEAYIRRAARNYGLATREGDPARVMDALRVSGQVDEADLRIAEGILALTDRVSRQGHASLEDYRQAFMLYLLYHRGQLGA